MVKMLGAHVETLIQYILSCVSFTLNKLQAFLQRLGRKFV